MSKPQARQEPQELVVEGRRLQQLRQHAARGRLGVEHLQHGGVLVAQDELDRPVLVRLEARRVAERAAELRVLARGQRGQHRPLLGQRALDVLHPGQAFQRRGEVVVAQVRPGAAELVQHQLEPQLARLVLDDEQQLVVVLRVAPRVLGRQQVSRSR